MNCERRRLTRKPRIRWEYKVQKHAVKLLHNKSLCAVKEIGVIGERNREAIIRKETKKHRKKDK
jgi:hypothetical protein